MRYLTPSMLLGLALALSACNPSDQRDANARMHGAREQAKRDLDKAKEDLKQAGREASKDFKQADREAEKALSDARAKIHETLRDQNVDRDRNKDDGKR